MGKLLVHLTHGPESPTRAVLAFWVAKTAIEDGHEVALFLAGDSVELLRAPVLEGLAGLGVGPLRTSFDAVVAAGSTICASSMSSKARGVDDVHLPDGVVFGTPSRLIELTFWADRVLTY